MLADFVRSRGPVEAALDIGCGDGRLTALVPASSVVGVDVSEVALSRARRRAPSAQFLLARPDEPLPVDDSSFDLVLCAETIEHVRDVQLLLSEARRALRPGGRLALTTPAVGPSMRPPDPFDPHIRFFTRRSLRRVLGEMGFEVESLRRRSGTLLALARR